MINIYEDELIKMFLPDNPLAVGHIVVAPKEDVDDLEAVSKEVFLQLCFGSSYAATALFELAHAQGTNMIFQEHPLRVDVLARSQDDGLNILWEPRQANPQELQSLAKSIKDDVDVSVWKKDNPQTSSATKEKEVIKQDASDGKVNYLLKSLHRAP